MTFAAGEVKKQPPRRRTSIPRPTRRWSASSPSRSSSAAGRRRRRGLPERLQRGRLRRKNRGGLFLHVIDHGAHARLRWWERGEDGRHRGPGRTGYVDSRAIELMGPVSAQPPGDMSDRAQVEDKLKNVIGGTFNPADFFKGAKILGGVDLAELLTAVRSSNRRRGAEAPLARAPGRSGSRRGAASTGRPRSTKSDPLKPVHAARRRRRADQAAHGRPGHDAARRTRPRRRTGDGAS